MLVLLATLFFIGCALVVIGLSLPLFARDPVEARLERFGASRGPRSLEEMELRQPFSERVLRPLAQRLASSMQRMDRSRDTRQQQRKTATLQQRLNQAGNPHGWTPTDFLGVKALSALGTGGVIFLLMTAMGQGPAAFLIALGGAFLGFVLPDGYLTQLIGKRRHELEKVLPDSLDLLSICVEAGLGFDAAIERMVRKSDNALTREFARVLAELRVGRPRREALKDVIARTQVPDLANFISAVIQADQLGVSITQVLAVQTDQMRVVRRQRAEEKAAQAPIKMLIPMVIFIFPSVCTVILGPMWPQLAGGGAPPP